MRAAALASAALRDRSGSVTEMPAHYTNRRLEVKRIMQP